VDALDLSQATDHDYLLVITDEFLVFVVDSMFSGFDSQKWRPLWLSSVRRRALAGKSRNRKTLPEYDCISSINVISGLRSACPGLESLEVIDCSGVYQQAMDEGSCEAMLQIAWRYEMGTGVAQDYAWPHTGSTRPRKRQMITRSHRAALECITRMLFKNTAVGRSSTGRSLDVDARRSGQSDAFRPEGSTRRARVE
jgi:hypothetical protein